DLDAFEANMAQVHAAIASRGKRIRAHVKAHKTTAIALRQIAAGAHSICCQKASEAEVFVDAGIEDVLITNQIVGSVKCARVARMARRARVGVCVDHLLQVRQMGEAAQAAGSCVQILIEVDIGHGRCGVTTAEQVVALALAIAAFPDHLALDGIHAFRGSAQHMRLPDERRAAVAAAVEQLRGLIRALNDAGFACPVVTGGGTGTYLLEALSDLYTEVQPGSYVLMDVDYAANTLDAQAPVLRHALTVLCSVISERPQHAVLDGGLKTFAVDQGLPRALAPGWRVKSLSDEHTIIVADAGTAPLGLGSRVQLLPGHCDPTVNLHDWIVAVRDGVVQETWAVDARGALF
ncbi:MAG: DSD1 family PLP-dependent enzyme, partial [Herminiimonas sp.]|nr:DSD1 family PLP-dependent enzyme [Herminiimonas sp.]